MELSGPTITRRGARSVSRRAALRAAAVAIIGGAATSVGTASAAADLGGLPALWRIADRRGIQFGSSTSTWQVADRAYAALHARQSRLLLTEDDLLWYRLKPTPDAPLEFERADRIVRFAQSGGQRVLGAHLVWDQGFGHGWSHHDLWGMSGSEARHTLFGTVRAVVARYRDSIGTWSVVNEAVSESPEGDRGLRQDVPWYATIGRSYVRESFEVARVQSPAGLLVLNEFGFEAPGRFGTDPRRKRRNTLLVIDDLLSAGAPVGALGIQGHLDAQGFARGFDEVGYRSFLGEVADRGLRILVTELDVLDDGLPGDPRARDRGVADVYRRFLDVVLDEPAVSAVLTFGLSDRYTWLEQAYPRRDGRARRPLPFDRRLAPTDTLRALARSLGGARSVSR